MLTLRYVKKTRSLLCPIPLFFNLFSATPRYNSFLVSPLISPETVRQLQAKDVVLNFREWFKSRHNNINPLLETIFEILRSSEGVEDQGSRTEADLALSKLNLRLNERLVLDVLNYGKDVLSCLKFFDWAGRQPGFYHSRATFHAIFKILSKAKLMSLMIDFLEGFWKRRWVHKGRFYNTLVMGYAVAGKPDVALRLFAKMRFQGIDLDEFTYHVLLNALVEEGCFTAFDMVAKQIKVRGFENMMTHALLVKGFCKQKELDRAESYTRELVRSGVQLSGNVIGVLVDGFCKDNQFEKAGMLVEEFRESGMVPMEDAYSVWIRDLVRAGRLEGALEFLKSNKGMDGYVPNVFRYNSLVSKLLRENRLEEVCDLLMEMKEREIYPDEVTMNYVLCFFCKAGMVDVALELYNSRSEFGLSPSSMAYNYLINTLCGDGSTDEAYRVLRNSINQGYFPGKKTFSILADALCREEKVDKMKELVLVALERNFMPSDSTYGKFVSALCRTGRVEEGYLIHGQLNRLNKFTNRFTYFSLINAFNNSNRGDIAARLLIEMQEKGHSPTRRIFRDVILCLFDMENPEYNFHRLLEIQLSRHEPSFEVFNFFIAGAGHAKKPELARKVYEMMGSSGIVPVVSSNILMLQSYLKSEKISDALNFFHDLSEKLKIGTKLRNTMIVGLCKVNKPDVALSIFEELRGKNKKLSLECYEELVLLLCSHKRYDTAVIIVNDLIRSGRTVSSFIGNVLLLHSLKTPNLYEAWVRSRDLHTETASSWALGELIGTFSVLIRENQDIENLEEVIKQIFPLDIYTYNLLLRRISMIAMDDALKLFKRLCQKGYEPNKWTFDILVHGFYKHGMKSEARRWAEEMFRRGFDPTEYTTLI